ncbi:MAG: GHKL domain-containing protein [Lachnospiraceae bacterium]|nr:GHKL domain-containing protein [Lachnospiraceae bacterium]
MYTELTHTPGILYAIAYWISAMIYCRFLPKRATGMKRCLLAALFFVLICGFMALTDHPPVYLFFLFVSIEIGMIYLFMYLMCDMPPGKTVYYCARAFMLGELATSLGWLLYYYSVTRMVARPSLPLMCALMASVYLVVFGFNYVLEKRQEKDARLLQLSSRDIAGALAIAASTYLVSNISFAVANTPFSMRYSNEIFIMRTLTDFGGVIILLLYHNLIVEVSARTEAELEQQLLQMQYSNYQISQESIDVINQKYHDLKHQIAALRFELNDEEKYGYLTQMEDEIRQYEAENKTGNKVLDTILTAKSLVCQNQRISMNVVADGSLLDFMSTMDLSALFGNALDNAIRGAASVEDENERLIRVVVCEQMGFVLVKIENRYAGEVRFDGKDLLTTKNNKDYHGYGVKSIRKTVEKYDGTVTIRTDDGWFLLSILFPARA